MTVRTRIAPSPTGYMHVGNLRTALWDYFLARQHGGQFVIRVEDTDQTRLVPGVLQSLLGTFKKMQLDYDEGPILNDDGTLGSKGNVGPYVQSERLHLYKPYAEQLLKDGHGYVCFCTKDRLEEMRAVQIANKQTPKYDRLCLKLSAEEIQTRLAAGEAHVIRMKIPEGTSTFTDAIRGVVSFNNADVDDQVLIKADGFPTYHLAVVVDDHLMNISHVLRGEEWLSSTPKQLILHQMLGWTMPTYAHVPLILNADKSKLSKRQGDVSVEDYLAKGYLPEALENFLSIVGFNPTGDREVYTREELVNFFDLSKVNSSGGVFNVDKLNWMNQQYIQKKTGGELAVLAAPFLEKADVSVDASTLEKICEVERMRLTTLVELPVAVKSYQAALDYEPSLLVWKKADAADAKKNLLAVQSWFQTIPDASFDDLKALETFFLAQIVTAGLKNGPVLWPLRVALSGQANSPSPFELMWVLGREEALKRIQTAMTKL